MSEVQIEHHGEEHDVVVEAGGGSLSQRMAHRAEQLEKQQTDWFPIPGWEDVLEVELRALGYRAIKKTVKKNERIRDEGLRELYSLADQIANATVSFREVLPNGKTQPVNDDWVALARRLDNCPDQIDTRRAILFLVGEKRIHFLVDDWGNWARSVRSDVDEEVVEDFGETG